LYKQRDHAVGHDASKRAAPESSRADSTAQGSRAAHRGRAGQPQPGRFHRRHHPPELADEAKVAPKMAPARSASPIRNRHRSHDYGSLSIIVKSLLLCES
jgi:hypothetical protein